MSFNYRHIVKSKYFVKDFKEVVNISTIKRLMKPFLEDFIDVFVSSELKNYNNIENLKRDIKDLIGKESKEFENKVKEIKNKYKDYESFIEYLSSIIKNPIEMLNQHKTIVENIMKTKYNYNSIEEYLLYEGILNKVEYNTNTIPTFISKNNASNWIYENKTKIKDYEKRYWIEILFNSIKFKNCWIYLDLNEELKIYWEYTIDKLKSIESTNLYEQLKDLEGVKVNPKIAGYEPSYFYAICLISRICYLINKENKNEIHDLGEIILIYSDVTGKKSYDSLHIGKLILKFFKREDYENGKSKFLEFLMSLKPLNKKIEDKYGKFLDMFCNNLLKGYVDWITLNKLIELKCEDLNLKSRRKFPIKNVRWFLEKANTA
jgi:hypothetical protein